MSRPPISVRVHLRSAWSHRLTALTAGMVFLAQAAPALGYCRTTTCSSETDDYCAVGDNGCIIDGLPLSWPLSSTLDFVLDEASAEEADVDDAATALTDAVGAWSAVRCGEDPPQVTLSIVNANEAPDGAGTISVEFVASDWPYEEEAVGRTMVEFNDESGWVVGATIYLNSESYVLSEDPSESDVDLTAVLTHEIGHVLALAHTNVAEATMQSEATSGFSSELRTLESDDETGICSLYPPESETVVFDLGEGGNAVMPIAEEPAGSGCSHTPSSATGRGWLGVGLLLAVGAGVRTARRRGRLVRL